MNEQPTARPDSWRWAICGLLLLATMLNYMDRQTLAQLATTIKQEFQLNNKHYGRLEKGFGIAFAVGALAFGLLVDRTSPRWVYPFVLIGWSAAGIATGYADRVAASLPDWLAGDGSAVDRAFHGFWCCRVALGFFEAGHWPCALVTTQVILARKDRSLGNSILQSGAAIGAIVTPMIVLPFLVREPLAEFMARLIGLLPAPLGDGALLAGSALPAREISIQPGSWRLPFFVIGATGMLWTVPWLLLIRKNDLDRTILRPAAATGPGTTLPSSGTIWRMYAVLVVIVITINLTWQFFRAWLPMFLEEQRHYSKEEVAWFISAYYIATDIGCISVGLAVKWLVSRDWDIHRARLLTFAVCCGMALLSVPVAFLPPGPLLLALLLLVGAGTLGLFPNYYAFAQELSRVHQGVISGSLGTITWLVTSQMQEIVGEIIDKTRSYTEAIVGAGLVPLLALAALLLFWPRRTATPSSVPVIEGQTAESV